MATLLNKEQIIKEAIPLLAEGISTEVIAKPYGITGRTLRNWLINHPDAEEAREHYLTDKLMECGQAIDDSQDTFPLARAREQFKYWSWIAERRLPSKFAPKQEASGMSITINVQRDEPGTVTIEHDSSLDSAGK